MYQYPFLRIAHVLFWLLYGTAEHISHVMYGENHWQGSLFAPMTAMICTAIFALIYERTEDRALVFRVPVLVSAGLVSVFIWHNLSRLLHYHITFEELLKSPFLNLWEGSSYSVLVILVWAGLFVSAHIHLQKKAQQEELLRIKSSARDAQLQQLLYQLNPHFLFNVLNSIDVAILQKENDTAHNMVVKLSRFLRSTLEHKFNNKIQLQQELDLLNNFVEIEQQRFHQHIQIKNHIQEAALTAFLPPLLLQPLMENAIKFSWHLGGKCTIELSASITQKHLKILLKNPYDASKVGSSAGTNTGLVNVANRLKLLYAENGQLQTFCNDGQFEVIVTLPLEVAL
ncbi:MAG: histidine kinase [Aliiglaciecola sp.]